MKILITGAAGFVGSNLAYALTHDKVLSKNIICCIDDFSFGNKKNVDSIQCHNEAFEDIDDSVLDDVDMLVHCATSNIIYAMDKPVETFMNNATNTIRLFQRFKDKKIIYTSTASVYGQADILPTPEDAQIHLTNAYDQSKYIAELFLQQRGNYTTLRLSNVYGPNQRPDNPFCGVMGRLLNSALHLAVFKINGDGTQTRDFTFIDDVVNAIVLAIYQEAKNTVINIASGTETSINDLVNFFPGMHVERIESRKIDGISRRCLDIEKAKYLLGWEPKVLIGDGINKTMEWMKSEL